MHRATPDPFLAPYLSLTRPFCYGAMGVFGFAFYTRVLGDYVCFMERFNCANGKWPGSMPIDDPFLNSKWVVERQTGYDLLLSWGKSGVSDRYSRFPLKPLPTISAYDYFEARRTILYKLALHLIVNCM